MKDHEYQTPPMFISQKKQILTSEVAFLSQLKTK